MLPKPLIRFLFLSSLLISAGRLSADAQPSAPANHVYLEAQTDLGLDEAWLAGINANSQYWSLPGYKSSGEGLSLEGGMEWDDHWRLGLWLEEDEGSFGVYHNPVAFHKIGVNFGYFQPFLGFLRAGVDLGLGAYYQTIDVPGAVLNTTTYPGQMLQGDLRLQADLRYGFYLDGVWVFQDLDTVIGNGTSSILNKASLRLGAGYRF